MTLAMPRLGRLSRYLIYAAGPESWPARPLSSPDGTVPPMPWETTNAHTQGSAAAGKWRTAMMPLLKMMRRTPPS
jgi:hypothetical protein